MGNRNSGNYEALDEEEINIPLFKELHLVIIGCHGSGKNDIGNAILRKNAFKFFTSFNEHYIKKKRTVFGTKVTLFRVPGWSGELNLHQKHREIRQEVRDAVRSFKKGPHAIILAIKVNSTFTRTTQETLEKVLTERFWDHTIIIFTGGHKQMNIEYVIKQMNIKSLIETCHNRYCVLQKPTRFEDSKKLIEDIALMIAEKKNVPLHFFVDESEQHNESHEKNNLLKRMAEKIEKLKSCKKNSRIERTESENEIRRLQDISSIHGALATNPSQYDQSTYGTINTDRPTSTIKAAEEIHHTEASMRLSTKLPSANNPALFTSELKENLKCDSRVNTFSEVDLRSWRDCLVKILENLTEEQFKKIKNKISYMKNDKIPTLHTEGKDRDTLARNMIEYWGEDKCIIYTRDLLKDIPRNDKETKGLILPFLQRIGESW